VSARRPAGEQPEQPPERALEWAAAVRCKVNGYRISLAPARLKIVYNQLQLPYLLMLGGFYLETVAYKQERE
jgi:hypothetical protein